LIISFSILLFYFQILIISRDLWWKRKFDGFYLDTLQKNDRSLFNSLRSYGFENMDFIYPVHIFQQIPVAEILGALILIMIFINLVNSESKD